MSGQVFTLGYVWEVEGDLDEVFYYLSHIATWPTWWPQIVKVETAEPDRPEIRVGDTALMRARSFLPYGLDWRTTVRKVEEPNLIEVESTVTLGKSLDLSGIVSFELTERDGKVTVVNRQVMTLLKPLPKWLFPIAEKVFNFNHDYAMKRGLPGLKSLLQTKTGTHSPKIIEQL